MHCANTIKQPHFSYHVAGPDRQHLCIEVNGKPVHPVTNLNQFYGVLGYTIEWGRRGMLPEEFVWIEYTAPDAPKSPAHLQAKLIEYLAKYSDAFIEQYGDRYVVWLHDLPQS